MARKQRKAKAQRRQTHAEFLESNVHYLPQAQKQKQVLIQGRNPNQKEYIQNQQINILNYQYQEFVMYHQWYKPY